jgi:hypothetical protein
MTRPLIATLLGMSLAAAACGGAVAQDAGKAANPPAQTPSMGAARPDMSKMMSDKDKKTMTMCRGMDREAMAKTQSCMDMMKAHPDMMKPK